MNRLGYRDNLSDKEWELIEPILKTNTYQNADTRCKYPRREMVNAMFYILRKGSRWTDLPHDFPPWKSVYSQILHWRERDIFMKINLALRTSIRMLLKKNPEASVGIADRQSVKNTEKRALWV
ncbi:MAG: transposase [Methylococcales bacterium]|nr:transposase [Methylococcales bacterium]